MGSCQRPKIVNLSMDIEDIYGDVNILNDQLHDLILFFSSQKIPCDLYLTGLRLETLGWLKDLIAITPKLSRYIRIGYHSNTHSFNTIPVMSTQGIEHISYVEENQFDCKYGKNITNKGGILTFKNLFKNSSSFRCPAFCWTTEYFIYMLSHNMHFTTMDIQYWSPFSYMSLVVLPVNEKPLEAYTSFDTLLRDIVHYDAVSLYFHPARLIYDNFWDKSKYRNIYPDYQEKILHLKELIQDINNSFQIISIEDTNTFYHKTAKSVYDSEKLLCESLSHSWRWGRLPAHFFDENLLVKCKNSANEMYEMERIC